MKNSNTLDRTAAHIRSQVARRTAPLTDTYGQKIYDISWDGGDSNYPDPDGVAIDFYPMGDICQIVVMVDDAGEEWPQTVIASLDVDEARTYYEALATI